MGQTKFVERWHSDAFESRDIALQIFDDLKKTSSYSTSFHWVEILPNQTFKTISINENGLRSKVLIN